MFDNHKYEVIGSSGKLKDTSITTYYKVFDNEKGCCGVVKCYHEKDERPHPNVNDHNIVLPIEYDSIYVGENESQDLEHSYYFYGYKNGKRYDKFGNDVDGEIPHQKVIKII